MQTQIHNRVYQVTPAMLAIHDSYSNRIQVAKEYINNRVPITQDNDVHDREPRKLQIPEPDIERMTFEFRYCRAGKPKEYGRQMDILYSHFQEDFRGELKVKMTRKQYMNGYQDFPEEVKRTIDKARKLFRSRGVELSDEQVTTVYQEAIADMGKLLVV